MNSVIPRFRRSSAVSGFPAMTTVARRPLSRQQRQAALRRWESIPHLSCTARADRHHSRRFALRFRTAVCAMPALHMPGSLPKTASVRCASWGRRSPRAECAVVFLFVSRNAPCAAEDAQRLAATRGTELMRAASDPSGAFSDASAKRFVPVRTRRRDATACSRKLVRRSNTDAITPSVDRLSITASCLEFLK